MRILCVDETLVGVRRTLKSKTKQGGLTECHIISDSGVLGCTWVCKHGIGVYSTLICSPGRQKLLYT